MLLFPFSAQCIQGVCYSIILVAIVKVSHMKMQIIVAAIYVTQTFLGLHIARQTPKEFNTIVYYNALMILIKKKDINVSLERDTVINSCLSSRSTQL
jgi:hypothetical protein